MSYSDKAVSESSDEEDVASELANEEEDKKVEVEQQLLLSDKMNFLFFILYFPPMNTEKMDAFIAVIIEFYDNKTFTYRKVNNTGEVLITLPS